MSYRIQLTSQRGLIIPKDKVAEFIDAYADAIASKLGKQRQKPSDYEAIRKKADEILGMKSVSKKTVLMREFLADDAKYPFAVSTLGDGSLEVVYEAGGWGEWWDNGPVDVTLRAVAPHVKRNAYLGFVGEDMAIWSYVFDGHGSFRTVKPQIDWRGIHIPEDDEEEEDE